MKKILVVFTGGTIGSSENGGIIDVDASNNYKLISLYKQNYSDDVEFQTAEIMHVLSENITAKHWSILCNYLLSLDFSDYSGIIITHGSDTLAFTSALVGMMFAHTQIPICLVASNKPLDTQGANGLDNFAKAVELITKRKVKGIFTIYDDIYPATRILPADSVTDKFSAYGSIDIEDFFVKSNEHTAEKLSINSIDFKNNVLMVYGYPNINFSAYTLTRNTVAVLYIPYHSGTACTDFKSPDYSFINFVERCQKHDIPVYISGIKSLDSIYTTLDTALNAGAIPLYNISDVSAYMKIMIAYNQEAVDIGDLLSKNLYFETL